MGELLAKDVKFTYWTGGGISAPLFRVREGEIVLLLGETGSGKTTLLRVLNGVVPHLIPGRLSGDVLLDGRSITPVSPRERLKLGIATVLQFPEDQLLGGRVEDLATEDSLRMVGAEHLIGRRVSDLSGGEKQRVAIAMAVSRGRRFLLLDEPFSLLDSKGASSLIRLIRELRTSGLGIVIAEHRFWLLSDLVDRVYSVSRGVVEEGLQEEDYVQSEERRNARRGEANGDVAISFHKVTFWYKHGSFALRNVSFQVPAGCLVAVVGDNGSGKSTLLKLIAGLLKPKRGEVALFGKPVKSLKDAASQLVYVPQNPEDFFSERTVREEISFTLSIARMFGTKETVEDIADCFSISQILDRPLSSLSGGEKLLVALASAYARKPRILLLDESARGLGMRERARVAQILWRVVDKGATVILATNDLNFAESLKPDIVLKLEGGEVRRASA